MKSHSLSKRVTRPVISQLIKYASFSIIVLGLVSIIAFRSTGDDSNVEIYASQEDEGIFGLVDETLLDATPDWIQSASVAMNNEGTIITAYTKMDSRLVIEYGLYTRICKSGIWENPVVIFGYEDITGIFLSTYHQVTINELDQAGVVYKLAEDQRLGDPKFRVAYFDGSTWNYTILIVGDIFWSHTQYPIMVMDSKAVLYVAYQILNSDYSCDVVVARFNNTGLIDETHFPTLCGTDILLSINKKDEVMMLQNYIGSRIFNGYSWGELVPFSSSSTYLKFYDSGKADIVGDSIVAGARIHYHYNGTSWGTGHEIIDMYEYAEQSAVAASNNGTIMLAYTTHETQSLGPMVKARFFNGRAWGSISTLLDDGIWSENPRVLVDGKGRFAVIHDSIWAYCFDGMWHGPVILDGVWGVLKPAIAMNDNGDFIIIQSDGLNYTLYGHRFFFRPTGTIPIIRALPWMPMLLFGD